jgi:hypothetical protein
MRVLLSLTSILTLAGGRAHRLDWPHWRGPSHNGVSSETGLPVTGAPPAPMAPAGGASSEPLSHRRRHRASADARAAAAAARRPAADPVRCKNLETENVAWKIPLPAYSGSTPIISGDTIFLNVATAANTGELELWAIDRASRRSCGSGRSPTPTTWSASRTCRRRRR